MAMKSITMDTDGTEPPPRDVSPIHSVSGLLEVYEVWWLSYSFLLLPVKQDELSIQLATMRTAIIIYMNDEQVWFMHVIFISTVCYKTFYISDCVLGIMAFETSHKIIASQYLHGALQYWLC